MSFTHHFSQCLGLEIHHTAWGDSSAPVVVLWHGLTRTCRDFDELATALSREYYVLCPDTPGRGLSQWSDEPERVYTIPFYAGLARNWLDQLGVQACHWVGTSMGGLIGMLVAVTDPERISKLLLNDVGPEVPMSAIERIRTYAGMQPEFNTLQELESWLRQVYIPFGENTDAFWRRMAINSFRRKDNGKLCLHYDPRLVIPFQHYQGETLWEVWPQINCPIRILRGEHSDVLLPEHAERMCLENRNSHLLTIAGVAHAPTLANEEQGRLVLDFLADSGVAPERH